MEIQQYDFARCILHTAGVAGSNPAAPTIVRCIKAILVEHCQFGFFSMLKSYPSAPHPTKVRAIWVT